MINIRLLADERLFVDDEPIRLDALDQLIASRAADSDRHAHLYFEVDASKETLKHVQAVLRSSKVRRIDYYSVA